MLKRQLKKFYEKSLTFLFDLMSLPRIVQIYFLVILFLISLIILAADYFLSNAPGLARSI